MMSSTKAAARARSVTSSPASSFATLSPLPATKAEVLDRAASHLSSVYRKEFVALMEARHVYRFASYTGTGTYRHTRTWRRHLNCVVYSLLRGVYMPKSLAPPFRPFDLSATCAPQGGTGHCAPGASPVCSCRAAGNCEFVVGEMASQPRPPLPLRAVVRGAPDTRRRTGLTSPHCHRPHAHLRNPPVPSAVFQQTFPRTLPRAQISRRR